MYQRKDYDLLAFALLIVTAIIWGASWPLGRYMVSDTFGETIPPIIISMIRYVIVVVIFLLFFLLNDFKKQTWIIKEKWKTFTAMGILSVFLYQIGYLYGEIYTAASDASLVVATGPFWIVLFSYFIGEEFDQNKIIGTILGFIGVILIVSFSPNDNVDVFPDRLLGNSLILMAAISYAIYTVLLRRLFNFYKKDKSKNPSSLLIIGWVSIFGLLFLLPVSLILHPQYIIIESYANIPVRIWVGIIYLSFLSTIVAYYFYIEGVKRLGAGRAGVFINFVPVVGVLLSGLFLGEKIDLIIHFSSFLLIFIGVTLVNRNNSKNHKAEDNL